MAKSSWLNYFLKRAVLWVVPVIVLWWAITPLYNHFLTVSTQSLLRLTESPSVTTLQTHDRHNLVITRSDYPTQKGKLASIQTTSVHFHLILMGILFMGIPGIPSKERFSNLGVSLLISVFFHLTLLFFYVKFIYATQLGSWSASHYGPFGQNFWGLGKHLLDLPFKFALPLILWLSFYFQELRDNN